MVVFPLNPKSDQVGNAARVEFHGLGLRCNMNKAKSMHIFNHINSVYDNYSFFKANLKSMRSNYLNDEHFNSGIKSIIGYIN